MTIFIPEFFIYWSNCPNFFFIEYSTAYVFIVDTFFFDYDNYTVLYKTGIFSKSGYTKYPKWINLNFYKYGGIEILRARMGAKFFFFKKFGVKKLLFSHLKFKNVGYYYQLEVLLHYNLNHYSLFDFIKDKNIYTDAGNWYTWRMHPRKWKFFLAKWHMFLLKVRLNDGLFYDIHFRAWDKLYLYAMGGIGKQLWVNMYNYMFYSFYDRNWFAEIYIIPFFNSYVFTVLYRSFFPMIFDTLLYFHFILYYLILCYYFYLFYHFIYDISFLFFFYNKFVIKFILEIYYLLIGFYTSLIFWISSIRMFKKTVLSKNYDLENLLKVKQLTLRNYCFKLFLNKGITEQQEKIMRELDDCVNYPFFLIYLFKNKLEFFISLERFLINLSYFFNKSFFNDLLRNFYLRNLIGSFNFLIAIFFFVPFYMILNFFYFLCYKTYCIICFFRDSVYEYYNGMMYEDIYEDILNNILFDKVFEEKYDYFIYWFNIVKFKYFTLSYYRKDRDSVHNKYQTILSTPRSKKDTPIEDILFEYWNERNKYSIGISAYGKSKGHKSYWFFNKLLGNYVKGKMYMHNHYLEEPFFFSMYTEYLYFGFNLKKIIWLTSVLNFLQITILKKIKNRLNIYYGFWYYNFYIFIFYPIFSIFYILDWIHLILINLAYNSSFIILYKLYLNFIILKDYLLSFFFLYNLWNICKYIFNFIKKYVISFRLYIRNYKILFLSLKFWKFCLLFYFYFLRYRFVLKIFKIFLIRLWIIGLLLVIIVFFFDINNYVLTYVEIGDYAVRNWRQIFKITLDPQYSFFFFFKNYVLIDLMKAYRINFEFDKYFFDWSILHMDWVAYIQVWYKQYVPRTNIFLRPLKDLLILLHLDYKWWLFQIKLYFSMDIGFIYLNKIFAVLNFPIYYHVWRNFYDILIFSYVYFFIDWFNHFFIYSLIYFIDTKLNFFYLNNFLIFIINLFYNIYVIIKYYFYFYFIKNFTLLYYDKWFIQSIKDLLEIFPPFFNLFLKYKLVRIYTFFDLILIIEYYWFYFYHYLFYYSYEFLHTFYNYLVYIVKFFFWKNWQYSTYNLIGYYDAFNTNVTMPLLVFFHKFFMFFLNSSNNLNYWQQDYPNVGYGFRFPFVISKKQQFTGSTTLNRFFFETWIIKVNLLENFFLYGWRYNSRFSSVLFLLSYIYILVIILCLVRIFIYASRSFRKMNAKERLSQSGARLWHKIRPLDNRHLFDDLEYDWVYSWDWIYDFPKYRKEFYPLDPITDRRQDQNINVYEGEYVVYKFLTKLFEYKKYQNKKYMGWNILNQMDSYYNKRYIQVLNTVQSVYYNNITGIDKQTDMFTGIDFFFEFGYYRLENNPKWRLYHSHENRYEQFNDIVSYENFLFKVAMPFLYTYCDDTKFVKYYMKNIGRMRTNLWKFETMLNEKEKHGLNFTEFFFTDKVFYDKFIDEFGPEPLTIFGAFIEHRIQNVFNFKPWYKNTFVLHRPGIYKRFYKWEDYFLKLSKWDEKYFNNLFNLTFYNVFEWPLLIRTKIQLEQLQGLFDAFDPFTMLEETEFLPSNTGIIRGDTETDYEIQQRVNHYWTKVIRKTDDNIHNELGLFTVKVTPLGSYLYGIYAPVIIVTAQFFDTFSFHSNFLDFIPLMFSYIFSMFRYVDMEFSTWAINDPWFVVNPIMGVFITREYGIDIFLTFLGQGYQPWILFNSGIPANYHSSLFIYSYSNIDFYPFQNFFSKWEHYHYFYDVLPLNDKIAKLPQNRMIINLPMGFERYHIWRRVNAERFGFLPLFNEILGEFILYVVGFFTRLCAVIPLVLMWFFFYVFLYVYGLKILDNSSFGLEIFHYQMKKMRKYYDLFSKK